MQVDPFWIWLIIKIGAVATALGAVYKFVWLPFKTHVVDKLNDFYVKVNYITAELKPNGGNSMRDQVMHIKRTVDKIDQRQLNFFHFDPHGIVETDAAGNLIWANRAYLQMTGRHPEEVIKQGWRNVIAESDRERVVTEWTHAVKDCRDFFSRFTIINAQGDLIKVEGRCLAMRGDDGELTGHLGFVIRMDQPPPGCRWCREVEILSDEVSRLMAEKTKDFEPPSAMSAKLKQLEQTTPVAPAAAR